jgi:IclR family acetate operon transcriptional repressor
MLTVFERIAVAQPIGVSALARMLDADKSAVQRDLMTLADAGWIRPSPGAAGQWELTPRVMTLAQTPHSANSLRQRARPVLEDLRAQTGETAYLTVPDGDRFVVLDALESHHMLRMVPPVGMIVPLEGSATARAIMAHMEEGEVERLLSGPAPAPLRRDFTATRERGYAINDGDIAAGAIALASAILTPFGRPLGALVLTGPSERLTPPRRGEIGDLLRDRARQLSQALG